MRLLGRGAQRGFAQGSASRRGNGVSGGQSERCPDQGTLPAQRALLRGVVSWPRAGPRESKSRQGQGDVLLRRLEGWAGSIFNLGIFCCEAGRQEEGSRDEYGEEVAIETRGKRH